MTMADKKKKTNPFKTLGRVLGYVFRSYSWHFLLVVVCILITAYCTLQSSLFTRTLIDDYILPLMGSANPDYAPLARRLVQLAAVLLVGVVTAYSYNRIMVTVSQGTMEKIRVAVFTHMESLQIGRAHV